MKKKEEKTEQKSESIGALWVNEGKSQKYLAGQIEIDGKLTKIVVFKNTFKKDEKHPDYRIYLKNEKGLKEPETTDDLPFLI